MTSALPTDSQAHRRITLGGAIGIGVGAIVGGGILALAGVAFEAAGPAAVIAFAVNGIIALMTAVSFGQMAKRFPESGGTYTFSRKVLSVEAAFIVGWVVWFASIVAAVLYALGFAAFLQMTLQAWWPDSVWMGSERTSIIAILTVIVLTLWSMRQAGGGGAWINVVKVVVFAGLIVGGIWAVSKQPRETTVGMLAPFAPTGPSGVLIAMGYTFIALQGFDLIAAVGGEVKDPKRNVPRAMVISLIIALAIYLPMLLVLSAVGGVSADGNTPIQELARSNGETLVAAAAQNFLGPAGYWLVLGAGVLSMFTALQANLFAASRIALSMARDHTLPIWMARISARNIPFGAVIATGVLTIGSLVALPDVAAAGAASSLIFLVTFAIAHWLCIVIRIRSTAGSPHAKKDHSRGAAFRKNALKVMPVIGGLACLALAIFQGIAVPTAGIIATVWISVGGLLFLTLLARSARLRDVVDVAANPELVRLRGHVPLVLVPVANPDNAAAMIFLADTLIPNGVGRVLLQNVIVTDEQFDGSENHPAMIRSQRTLARLIGESHRMGIAAETIVSVARNPMNEIARVARLHRCEAVLLGLSEIPETSVELPLEGLLSELQCDVVVLRAPADNPVVMALQSNGEPQVGSESKEKVLHQPWRVVIPIAGRGGHDPLLVRILVSLRRRAECEVIFLRVVSQETSESAAVSMKRDMHRLASMTFSGTSRCVLLRSEDPIETIVREAADADLLILGVQRDGKGRKLFGRFTRHISRQTQCPLMTISHRK
ncbi:MAG: amino acid permease [Planctomycetota bacterium]